MLSMIPSVLKGVTTADIERIKQITRATFPDVKQVATETLATWIEEPTPTLLIDVRSAAEYAVSHLRNALNLRTAREISQAITDRQPARTVLYCSVGFRSSRLAARIAKENIYNLEGSIFDWANQGRPIFKGEKPTTQVHPYSPLWSGLLKSGLAYSL
jgi:rhodanese-related sulfurtransferase